MLDTGRHGPYSRRDGIWHRRKLPLGSVFAAAAFSEPTLLALTVPPAESTARAGGKLHREANTAFLTRSARRDEDPSA
ncbi:MAG: hypothetical protein ACT4NY_14015 [Pseudonocardiales bacterium]